MAWHKQSGLTYTVKKVEWTHETSKRAHVIRSRLHQEVHNLDELQRSRAPHLIQLCQVFMSKAAATYSSYYLLVYQRDEGGTVDDVVLKQKHVYSEPQLQILAHRVVEALSHLHQHRIVHRNLNTLTLVLLDHHSPKTHVLLTGFDFSKKLERRNELQSACGHPYYRAPEMMTMNLTGQKPAYDTECDLWSLGVMLYYLLSGCSSVGGTSNGLYIWPFGINANTKSKDVPTLVNRQELQFSPTHFDNLSPQGRNLVTRLLTKDPKHRMLIEHVRAEPWIQQGATTKNGQSLSSSWRQPRRQPSHHHHHPPPSPRERRKALQQHQQPSSSSQLSSALQLDGQVSIDELKQMGVAIGVADDGNIESSRPPMPAFQSTRSAPVSPTQTRFHQYNTNNGGNMGSSSYHGASSPSSYQQVHGKNNVAPRALRAMSSDRFSPIVHPPPEAIEVELPPPQVPRSPVQPNQKRSGLVDTNKLRIVPTGPSVSTSVSVSCVCK